jgi:DNA-binding FrmR family transcriptional regulator
LAGAADGFEPLAYDGEDWMKRSTKPIQIPGAITMSVLTNEASRTDILNRLKRAEGQMRGVIEEGEPCLKVAQQLSAVRKALDSTFVRMTVCYLEQELDGRLEPTEGGEQPKLSAMLDEVETLLARMN